MAEQLSASSCKGQSCSHVRHAFGMCPNCAQCLRDQWLIVVRILYQSTGRTNTAFLTSKRLQYIHWKRHFLLRQSLHDEDNSTWVFMYKIFTLFVGCVSHTYLWFFQKSQFVGFCQSSNNSHGSETLKQKCYVVVFFKSTFLTNCGNHFYLLLFFIFFIRFL